MTSCVLMLVYASLYYMYNQDMVYGLSRLLSRYSQYNKGTRDQNGGRDGGRGGQMGKLTTLDVSVNASYINNHGYALFMCGDHF